MFEVAASEVLHFSRRHVSRAVRTVKRPWRMLSLYLHIRRDILGGLTALIESEGDRLEFRLGRSRVLLVNALADVHEVLVAQNQSFHKPKGPIFLGRVLGEGLLTAEEEPWRRSRRLVQPAFHSQALRPLAGKMAELTTRHMSKWQDGAEYDIAEEMTSLAFTIATDALFGFRDDAVNAEVRDSISGAMRYASRRVYSLVRLPPWVPTCGAREFSRAGKRLTEAIRQIVAERETREDAVPDLLSHLLRAEDSEGDGFTPQELRDQALTLLLAGHETTANALSWVWHLLAQHPEARERLEAELQSRADPHFTAPETLKSLPYLDAVIRETLRLYPPVWAVARQSVRPFQLGSATFPAGTRVIMLPWVIHRKAAFYASPDQFRPERWLDGSSQTVPRHAYMPFGAGPRMCIGRAFALMEMQIVVATVLQRYRLNPVPGHRVLPEPLVTLRPKSGVRVVLERRDLVSAQPREREAGASPSPSRGATCPFHGGSLQELP